MRRAPAIRWASAAGSSRLATASLQLLGQVGDLLDDLREGALDVAGQRLQLLARPLDDVGQLGDPRDQVGLLGDVGPSRTRWMPWTSTRRVPSGTLSMRETTPTTPTSWRSCGPGSLELGITRGDHRQHPVGAEHIVDQFDRALLADRERRQRLGKGDGVTQRQDR